MSCSAIRQRLTAFAIDQTSTLRYDVNEETTVTINDLPAAQTWCKTGLPSAFKFDEKAFIQAPRARLPTSLFPRNLSRSRQNPHQDPFDLSDGSEMNAHKLRYMIHWWELRILARCLWRWLGGKR